MRFTVDSHFYLLAVLAAVLCAQRGAVLGDHVVGHHTLHKRLRVGARLGLVDDCLQVRGAVLRARGSGRSSHAATRVGVAAGAHELGAAAVGNLLVLRERHGVFL